MEDYGDRTALKREARTKGIKRRMSAKEVGLPPDRAYLYVMRYLSSINAKVFIFVQNRMIKAEHGGYFNITPDGMKKTIEINIEPISENSCFLIVSQNFSKYIIENVIGLIICLFLLTVHILNFFVVLVLFTSIFVYPYYYFRRNVIIDKLWKFLGKQNALGHR